MSSTWGKNIEISIFGESHGNGIGVVINGLPAGEKIDMDKLLAQMARRAPGNDKAATPRKESDFPEILSGMLNDTTTGAPLCAVIRNTNTRSQDYGNLMTSPRPSHADYTGHIRYGGFNDVRGGGHFSGRLTAPLVFAGAVSRQIPPSTSIKTESIHSHLNTCAVSPPFSLLNGYISVLQIQAVLSWQAPYLSDEDMDRPPQSGYVG